ncbi:MAG TPA: crosslink repair DNA glycosylase YcaQ family protein [Rubrobacter sp.]|nr:crosslink repair DNA glycosylase YcaQ family protein [Rubrobacter sp.]
MLDKLLWEDRSLFEYWAHAASIVLTEDYPIHRLMMSRYPFREGKWTEMVRTWLADNEPLRREIVRRLRADGPLPLRAFGQRTRRSWQGYDPWTAERNVSRMLDILLLRGEVMVAGRAGGQKLWDLTSRVLPEWTPKERLKDPEVVRRAALRSLAARGVARAKDIREYFITGRYEGLPAVLSELEKKGKIVRVRVVSDDGEIAGPWYSRPEDIALAERIEAGEWSPRTTLLSPFDNLLRRSFIETLFNFYFKTEIYVPKEKRQYGYYLLPIVQGERLVGRADAYMDRKSSRLEMRAVHAEAGMEGSVDAVELRLAIEDLARFLRAEEIVFGPVPGAWAKALKA